MITQELYAAIKKHLNPGSTSTIGLVGLPGSGKSTMSRELGKVLRCYDTAAVPWEGDMYSTSSRENRTAVIQAEYRDKLESGGIDPDWPRKAYHYNIGLLVEHLDALKARTGFSAEGLCHPKKKSLDLSVAVSFPNERTTETVIDSERSRYEGMETWILADFALLTAPAIRNHLDLLVYVDAPYEARIERIRQRLLSLPTPIKLEDGLLRYIEDSQKRDFEIDPSLAKIVIDNTDFNNPKIIRA